MLSENMRDAGILQALAAMPVLVPSFGLGVSLLGLLIVVKMKSRSRKHGEPPLVPGLPFVGSGREFGENAVTFLLSMRKKFGDLFTIQLPFNCLHVIMNPHGFEAFTKHRMLDFDPIQRMVNHNVFHFFLKEARRIIKEAGQNARKSLHISESFAWFMHFINDGVEKLTHAQGTQTFMLKELLVDVQFRAIFNSIFGYSDESPFNYASARREFDIFHKYFNYLWLGFPLWLFPKASKAIQALSASHPSVEELLQREDLSLYMRNALSRMKENDQSHSDVVGHNLVYLHVNYNTLKSTFWMVAHLLHDTMAKEKLQEEVNDFVEGHRDENGDVSVTVEELERLPVLDSVLNETFRMCSGVLMIREVTEDTELQLDPSAGPESKMKLRKGDKIAMYPPALHHDPEIFENPGEFQYDRFIDKEFYFQGQRVRHPILPYGSLCPGQRMSRVQIKLTVVALMANFEMQFAPGADLPAYNTQCYGHEILPPVADVPICITPRERGASCRLHFHV